MTLQKLKSMFLYLPWKNTNILVPYDNSQLSLFPNRLLDYFWSSFTFIEKSSTESSHTPADLTRHNFPIDGHHNLWTYMTHRYHSKSTVKAHSWHCTFKGVWEKYNDIYSLCRILCRILCSIVILHSIVIVILCRILP